MDEFLHLFQVLFTISNHSVTIILVKVALNVYVSVEMQVCGILIGIVKEPSNMPTTIYTPTFISNATDIGYTRTFHFLSR